MNAAELLNAAITLHQQGSFAEAETVYRAVLQAEPRNADAMALLGCVLSEQKKHEPAIQCIERALSIDPKAALFHFHLGNAQDKAARYAEAIASFTRALHLQPNWAEALYNLGNAQRNNGDKNAAMESYQRTLKINPGHALALNNIAQLLLKANDLPGARQAVDAAYKLAPDHLHILFTLNDVAFEQNDLPTAFKAAARIAEIRLNISNGDIAEFLQRSETLKQLDEDTINALLALAASALLQLKLELSLALLRFLASQEPDKVEVFSLMGSVALAANKLKLADETYAQCFMLDPSFTAAPWNRSMPLLTMGKLREGFTRYRWRWFALEKFKAMRLDAKMWDGSDLTGKTILVHEEQGFGDSLQMLRFIPSLKKRGAKVWYYARPPLFALLKNWHDADRVLEWDVNNKVKPDGVDLVMGGMDLPGMLGATLATLPATVPYLPNPKQADPDFQLHGTGLKVGLVWSGNPLHKRDHERSVPLKAMRGLLEIPGIQFFSLQFKAKEADLELMRELNVTDLAPKIRTLADTAAFLSQLDLLISVDSAPAHLAGALGVKVWTLVTLNPDWRWLLGRDDSPWYPSLRLFRQEQQGNWVKVLENVKNQLIPLAHP